MKAIQVFLFILVFNVLLSSIVPYYNISQIDGVDNLDELQDLVGQQSEEFDFDAETEENQYVAQSLFFVNTYDDGIISRLRRIVEPPGTLMKNILPFGSEIPGGIVILFNTVYALLFTLALFEFLRGVQII